MSQGPRRGMQSSGDAFLMWQRCEWGANTGKNLQKCTKDMLSYCQMIWLKLKPLKCFCTELYVRLLPTEEPFKKNPLRKSKNSSEVSCF